MDPATTEIYALALHDALPFFAVPAVSVTVAELTPVSPVAEKLRVRSPAVPVIARLVKVATPVSVVVAVRVPPSVPPPVAIAAVTVTPPWLTGFDRESPRLNSSRRSKSNPLFSVIKNTGVTVHLG